MHDNEPVSSNIIISDSIPEIGSPGDMDDEVAGTKVHTNRTDV